MKRNYSFLFFLLVILTIISCENAPQPKGDSKMDYKHPIPFNPERYICYRSADTLLIDGKPLESVWDHAPWSNSFVDIEGTLKPEPSLDTKMKMLWDDTFFYIYAQLEEPHIWATLKQRDTVVFYDDDFEIFIDPDGDSHGYYELEANAYNTLWDLILLRPYRVDHSPKVLDQWNINGIKTAVHIEGTINNPNDTDSYWGIEWAIPWSALEELAPGGEIPDDRDQWRINFSRVDWTMESINERYQKVKDPGTGNSLPENNWVWSPTGKINMHMPEMWGYVQFAQIVAGEGETQFLYDPDEEVKWALWQLYFQQIAFFEETGNYTSDINQLTIPEVASQECQFDPKIYVTPNLFEITNESCTKEGTWSIRQDGKIELR